MDSRSGGGGWIVAAVVVVVGAAAAAAAADVPQAEGSTHRAKEGAVRRSLKNQVPKTQLPKQAGGRATPKSQTQANSRVFTDQRDCCVNRCLRVRV